jgi:D-lactate dehydrogenase
MHKLLTPQVARLGRPDVPPETDAVDPSFSEGTPESLKADLIGLLGETQVLSRAIDLVRFASDASPYRYIPHVVVRPKSIDDVRQGFFLPYVKPTFSNNNGKFHGPEYSF